MRKLRWNPLLFDSIQWFLSVSIGFQGATSKFFLYSAWSEFFTHDFHWLFQLIVSEIQWRSFLLFPTMATWFLNHTRFCATWHRSLHPTALGIPLIWSKELLLTCISIGTSVNRARHRRQQRCILNFWSLRHHLNLRFGAANYFRRIFFPQMSGQPVDTKALAPYEKAMKAAMNTIETHFLADKPFISGSTPSIADLSAYEEIRQLESVGVDFAQWPKINAWMARVKELPHYGQVHKFFDAFVARQRQQQQQAKMWARAFHFYCIVLTYFHNNMKTLDFRYFFKVRENFRSHRIFYRNMRFCAQNSVTWYNLELLVHFSGHPRPRERWCLAIFGRDKLRTSETCWLQSLVDSMKHLTLACYLLCFFSVTYSQTVLKTGASPKLVVCFGVFCLPPGHLPSNHFRRKLDPNCCFVKWFCW